MLFFKPSTQPT